MKKIGIIGGSGVYKINSIKIKEKHNVTTPFGATSAPVTQAEIAGNEFYFIPRHGEGHTILPHEVNYRANIFAMKKMGVDTIISLSAVGSLKEEISPTMIVLPDQFIDWTKGGRERSFFGNGLVGHVSTAHPIEKVLQERLAQACKKLKIDFKKDGTYLCIEGPQFSSKAESTIYRSFGASVIGMTNVPESYLAKEAGIAYATVALVTDYDCWKEEHCTVEEIMKVMGTNNLTAQKLVEFIIPDLIKNPIEFTPENMTAIMTSPESQTVEHKKIVNVLVGPQ